MAQTRLALVGINHKTASIEIREKYQLNRNELPDAHVQINEFESVEGVIILNTCNRLEFYIALSNGKKPFDIIRQYYVNNLKQDPAQDLNNFYIEEDINKVTRHLFEVISGLDSLVLGEYQIQGQIKEAYSIACEQKTVEKMLHKLLHAAFRAGKRVRSSTSIGDGKQSVSGVASEIMLNNTKPEDTIAIIGVNENTQIMAKTLSKAGYRNFIFANRTIYKAEMMAEQYGGSATDLTNIERLLLTSDAVFTCTGAKGYIVPADVINHLCVQERCPKVLVDMAVPRDIEIRGTQKRENYYDMESLKIYLDESLEAIRQKALPEAEKVIDEEVKLFYEWQSAQSEDIMSEYSEKFEMIRNQLLDELRGQYSEQIFKDIDKITKMLMHRTKSTFVRILVKEVMNKSNAKKDHNALNSESSKKTNGVLKVNV